MVKEEIVLFEHHINEFEEYLRLQLLSDITIYNYVRDVKYLFLHHGIHHSADQFRSFFIDLRSRVGDSRYNQLILVVKKVSEWAIPRGYLPSWFSLEVKSLRQVPKSKKRTKMPLFAYTREQKECILASTKNQTEYMLFWLALNTGLRKTELLELHIEDVSVDGVSVRAETSKARKSRFVPFVNKKQKKVIRGYLKLRSLLQDSTIHDYFFVGPRGGKYNLRGGTGSNLYRRLSDHCGFRVTLHNCRYTFASDVWYATSDVFLVQHLLGHSDPKQTVQYLKIQPSILKEQVREKLKGVIFV